MADDPALAGYFRYLPALSQGEPPKGVHRGRVDRVVSEQFPQLSGFRVFLCGSPQMVKDLKALAYKMGAALDDIHADAFVPAAPPRSRTRELSAIKCVFHAISITHSTACRSGIPRQADHLVR